jgi:hypothetical protein
MDVLQIGGLAGKSGPVIDNLAADLPEGIVYGYHMVLDRA